MRIGLTERFLADVAALPDHARHRAFDVVIALPRALRDPQRHSGIGLRKVHAGGIWEVRVGRDLRLVFSLHGEDILFSRAGTHDEVHEYLRGI
jgi:mRNA-degrading endonuclease YafQ of YafQ-DinJ toxin-antitoxin module